MAVRPRRRRSEPDRTSRPKLNPTRDLDVLADLVWAGYLTTTQLQRRHFPSQRVAQRRMRALLDLGLVRSAMQDGALDLDAVHLATPAALALLEEHGSFPGSHPAPGRLPRTQKLPHALAIRDVFVAALEAERAGAFEVADFRFDEDLTHTEPFLGAGLIPDAIARLKVGPLERAVGIEVDLGTETKAMLASKFSRWLRLLPPAHGAPVARLLVLATTARRRDLLAALASDAGLGAVVGVHLLGEARGALEQAARTFDLYVPPVRSERTANAPTESQIRPRPPNEQPVFRVRRGP